MEVEFVHGRQNPADATISSKHDDPELLEPLEQLQTRVGKEGGEGGGGGGERGEGRGCIEGRERDKG